MRVRTGVCAVVAVVAGAVGVAPASAATLPDQTLSSTSQVLSFSGVNADPTGQGCGPPTEQTCTSTTCDSFVVNVTLPDGSLPKAAQHPAPAGTTRLQPTGSGDMPGDGVLVTIHWPTDFDQWNLYVDDLSTGRTVAEGIDLDSNAQSVLIPQAHNGRYRVTIVPFYTDFNLADRHYSGTVKAYLDPTQRYTTKTALLPAIETMAPSNFHIGDVPPIASNPTGWRFTSDGTFANSCYADETAQFGSTRCLRFDNDLHNFGSGPLVLRFDYSADSFAGNCQMQQEIISSDASVADRAAGACVFHPQHAHFHYQNMGKYLLYRVRPDGSVDESAPVARSNKVGFCAIDVDNWSLTRPRSYSFPTCNVPNAYSNNPLDPNLGFAKHVPEYMGISPGWGDIYTWDLPQQYIDVSDPTIRGRYELVSRSNPPNSQATGPNGEDLVMSDYSRETGVTCINIDGSSVTTVKSFPSQSNTAPLPSCS